MQTMSLVCIAMFDLGDELHAVIDVPFRLLPLQCGVAFHHIVF